MQPDIVQAALFDAGEEFGHAVDERFAADEAHVGLARRRLDEMLAAAKADLEPRLAHGRGKQVGQRAPRLGRIKGELG